MANTYFGFFGNILQYWIHRLNKQILHLENSYFMGTTGFVTTALYKQLDVTSGVQPQMKPLLTKPSYDVTNLTFN